MLYSRITGPTDLMVIPEYVTPSGVVLADAKLHGGLGFEKMFDCFVYDCRAREQTKQRYFKLPKKVDENLTVIVDEHMTDKFQFMRIDVKTDYYYQMNSYGIVLIVKGSGTVNGTPVKKGDRLFVSYDEKKLVFGGAMTALLCAKKQR